MLDHYSDEELRANARKPRLRLLMEQVLADGEKSLQRITSVRDDAARDVERIGAENARIRDATAREREV